MKFTVRISDFKKTIRYSIYVAVVALIALVLLSIYVGNLSKEYQGEQFFIGFGLIIVITLLSLLVILFGVLSKKETVSITDSKVICASGLVINLDEITKINADLNRNGFNSLLIIHLADGSKISITPTNKFGGRAMSNYNSFLKNLVKAMPQR